MKKVTVGFNFTGLIFKEIEVPNEMTNDEILATMKGAIEFDFDKEYWELLDEGEFRIIE